MPPATLLPLPRVPLAAPLPVPLDAPLDVSFGGGAVRADPGDRTGPEARWVRWARWYERELGWPAEAGPPVRLRTGVRFDVLELPDGAGRETLRRMGAGPGPGTGPVALTGRRMCFLLAPGSADELPGLLEWLEWGGIRLDLRALGAGGLMTAPAPARRGGPGGAAVWLRPPRPGPGAESSLPALRPSPWSGAGGASGGPCLARLVATAAAACHRTRLLGADRDRLPGPGAVAPAGRQRAGQRLASS
ncbi:SCO3374 family protein [Streptomyces sp. NPDC048718]|uniref:SCO3374 family protein n=1 Tax=Streptomyces sp. NPDC048718 TaxID=3365587 RepID=UPI003713CCC3